MKVAVVGAGIIGVTTAFELACDGHEVTVFERRSSVAEETSFANAGVVAPGYVTPWAAPGMPLKVVRHLLSRHAPVRLARPMAIGQWSWMWRWWRACSATAHAQHRSSMYRLAAYSRERLMNLVAHHHLEFENTHGYLVLLRRPSDLALARTGLKLLADLGVDFRLVNAQRAREIEPSLCIDTALHAAVHLPADRVGNCRQFAHLLKQEAQRLGVRFLFSRQVSRLVGDAPIQLTHMPALKETGQGPDLDLDLTKPGLHEPGESVRQDEFDGAVVCAALGSAALLKPLGLRLGMVPVHGYSITMPLRHLDGHPDPGPRSGVMDERFKVAISRLGQRVRIAGGAELGGRLSHNDPAALATLYRVLDDWFPGCSQGAQAQVWKGARPMLADGPPMLGPSGVPGIWLNLGHGSSGWALACGSARVLADLMAGRPAEVSLKGLGIRR